MNILFLLQGLTHRAMWHLVVMVAMIVPHSVLDSDDLDCYYHLTEIGGKALFSLLPIGMCGIKITYYR